MRHQLLGALLGICIAIAGIAGTVAQVPTVQVREADAQVNGVRLHYRIAGTGSAIVLIHGYAQTSYMWNPVIADLARGHTVIVPDLRGAGASEKAGRRLPEEGRRMCTRWSLRWATKTRR